MGSEEWTGNQMRFYWYTFYLDHSYFVVRSLARDLNEAFYLAHQYPSVLNHGRTLVYVGRDEGYENK